MKNKKGFGVMGLILIIVIVMMMFYALLYLPIPAFKRIRIALNYFMIMIGWILLQIFIIVGYYYLGFYLIKGFNIVKYKFARLSLKMRDYIIINK